MKYCDNCLVHIRGHQEKCPLCKTNILDDGLPQDEVFPDIPLIYERHLAIRIMIFISIVTIVVSFAFHRLYPTTINWPILVVFGLVSMWLSLIVVIWKRHHISKNIMWQVIIVSALAILWDLKIGWRGWSLDYVIPITCVSAMFVMYITAKITKLRLKDYLIYFLLDGVFGIIPILFILFHWVNVIYPSVICVAISIIFISAIFVFQGENIKIELNKRMHI